MDIIAPSVAVWQMWVILGLVVITAWLYMQERIAIEISSLGVLTTLLVFFHFFPLENGLSTTMTDSAFLTQGFANPALLTVMALLVIGQGLFQSEALDKASRNFVRLGTNHHRITLVMILLLVFSTTAWMNNTPVAVMFIPILAAMAARTNSTPAQIMMPLSFTCILGGMTTLIGSSTNILASEIAANMGASPLGFFDITPAGLSLAIPGLLYVFFIMPYLLPQKPEQTLDDLNTDGRHYVTKIDIGPKSPFIGVKLNKDFISQNPKLLQNMRILRVNRGERDFWLIHKEEIQIQEGDQIIASATRQVLADIIKSGTDLFDLANVDKNERSLLDAVISPASRIIGRKLSQLTIQYETGCQVIGILRKQRMLRSQIENIRFEIGDVLLLVGSKKATRALSDSYDVRLLEWSETDLPHHRQGLKALTIFITTIILAATNILPLFSAVLIGAFAMIASGVLNIRQATRALDLRIFFLVVCAMALANSLQATQAPIFLAFNILNLFADSDPLTILTSLFLLVALATNFLSNNAAAILFTPIAVQIAHLLEIDTQFAIITVILAANCSFATPMAYQTNLLVMGPGRYQFKDFVKAGAPLVLLMACAYVFMAKYLYQI